MPAGEGTPGCPLLSHLHPLDVATGRQVSECPEAWWERSDFLAFPCCLDSLKDFYDIYEVAALKWKVGAGVRPGRERAAGSGRMRLRGSEAQPFPAGTAQLRAWHRALQGRLGPQPPYLPVHTQCSILVKSTETQTPLVTT